MGDEVKVEVDPITALLEKMKEANTTIGRGEFRAKWFTSAVAISAAHGKKKFTKWIFNNMVNGNYISNDNLAVGLEILNKGKELIEEKNQLLEKIKSETK